MPSIYSDQLKQAIIYIRAGELEIAKEIILEIIQNDPDYEKAWIWLVETVPDHAGKVDVLKTRLEEYPDNSPLTHRALQRLAPEVLKEQQAPPAVPLPVEEPIEEIVEEESPIQFKDNSEDIIRDRLGLDEDDESELFDTSPAYEEPSSEDVEFSGTDNFEDLFEDAPDTDESFVFENVNFEEINFDEPDLEESGFEEISFEEPSPEQMSVEEPELEEDIFGGEDDFENLFEDVQDQQPISTEELGRNLMTEDEKDEDLFEKDLENFLQNNESETLFVEQETAKPPQPEKQEDVDLSDVDLSDFDSWLSGEEEGGDQTEAEEDELSAFLANGFEMEPSEEESSTSQSNPFLLSEKESINLFGDDVAEDEQKIAQPKPTSQSQSVFSEEGLKELGIDEDEVDVQFDLDEGDVFPVLDDQAAEPVSADDLLGIGDDLRAEVMGNEVAKSPSKKLERTKANKKEKKKTNDKQTFLFGCSIIAAVLILTMIVLGYFLWQNWQARPPQPTNTLPMPTPTEEYITDAPWLEENPTEVPSETDQ